MSKIVLIDGQMQFLNCSIPFSTSNGLHIVSSGCGSGEFPLVLRGVIMLVGEFFENISQAMVLK